MISDAESWQFVEQQLCAFLARYVCTLESTGKMISHVGTPNSFVESLSMQKDWISERARQDNVHLSEDKYGFTHVCIPLRTAKGNMVSLVPFIARTSSQLLVPEQFKKQANELPRTSDEELHRIMLLCAFAESMTDFMHGHGSRESDLVMNYLSEVSQALSSERVAAITTAFFVRTFHLANCSIYFDTTTYRYHTNNALEQSYKRIESIIGRECRSTNAMLLSKDMRTDPLFSRVMGIGSLARSALAVPVTNAVLILFSDEDLREKALVISQLAEKVAGALRRAEQHQVVQESAVTDPLTGVYNRAYLQTTVEQALSQAVLQGRTANSSNIPTSAVMIDIDGFKNYNDTHGHLEGDRVLKSVTSALATVLAPKDCLGRYGGEEFFVLMPLTGREEALTRAERMREIVQDKTEVTVSCGLVTCLNSSAATTDLFREADNALYKAKRSGKNKVVQFIIVDKSLGVIDTQVAAAFGRT